MSRNLLSVARAIRRADVLRADTSPHRARKISPALVVIRIHVYFRRVAPVYTLAPAGRVDFFPWPEMRLSHRLSIVSH